jgi:hypothetical protein
LCICGAFGIEILRNACKVCLIYIHNLAEKRIGHFYFDSSLKEFSGFNIITINVVTFVALNKLN